ncbi:MAG: helix-turn-helix transcriptional regulator [Clostridia bacterium]|nr:helix-turn-helix transcriptional regulator [Clostridia bacterium]
MQTVNDHKPSITDLIYIEEEASSNWSFPLHQHKDRLEISYIVEGCVNCYIDSESRQLGAGDLLIKNAGLIHAEKMVDDASLQEICISFDGVHLEGLPLNHLVPETFLPVIHAADEPVIRELILYLAAHQNDLDDTLKIDLGCALISLLCHFLEEVELIPLNQQRDLGQTVQDVKDYLAQNYARKITLDDLSNMFFISPFYLSRQFKKFTGYTIKQYLLELQMGEAEKLLLFTDMPIKEISIQCGYDNLQYFYVQFKRYAQCTPIEYRKKHAKSYC